MNIYKKITLSLLALTVNFRIAYAEIDIPNSCNDRVLFAYEAAQEEGIRADDVLVALNKAIERADSDCFGNSRHSEIYWDLRANVRDQLNEKKRQVSDVLDEDLLETTENLRLLINLSSSYKAKLLSITEDISSFSSDIKGNFVRSFDSFVEDLNSSLKEINNSEESDVVQENIIEANSLVFNELKVTNDKLTELSILKSLLELSEAQYAKILAELAEDSGEKIEQFADNRNNLAQSIINEIETYLNNRKAIVNEKTSTPLETAERRLMTLLNIETEQTINETLTDALYLDRSNQFLSTVSDIRTKMTNFTSSNFNNIPLQTSIWVNATDLLNTVSFCESSEITHWHSLGCTYLSRYKTQAGTLKTSSIPTTIRYGLIAISRQVTDETFLEKKSYIDSLLDDNEIYHAAVQFDALLVELGGDA